uniref:Uncharacterized protein n=1 Tax=Anguilla anguilla TaxID=7936 RepID=A0A0E9V2J2_ANGAN
MDNRTMHEHSCLATKSEKTFLHFFCKNAPLQLASLLWFLNALCYLCHSLTTNCHRAADVRLLKWMN